jgi:predicted transcriptional regulator
MSEPTFTASVRLTPDEMDKLEQMAARLGKSKSHVLKLALQRFMSARESAS